MSIPSGCDYFYMVQYGEVCVENKVCTLAPPPQTSAGQIFFFTFNYILISSNRPEQSVYNF